ncbi:MAG: flagellar basal body P-ring formation chaperone FlgA [Acidobacteriota bacterium]|nr:flagellar basal body P-ring formation chaperone FlgA [Acidobacteriota bacterium]
MILPFLLAATLAATCHPVGGESILGRDLAAADARFSAIPADATLGFAPAPGSRRIFHGAELTRLAARYGIASDLFADACFDRPLQPIDRELLMTALKTSLALPDAKLEIAESSLYPVPRGEIVFPRPALAAAQNGAALWKGYVRYGVNRRFPIWVRVRIRVRGSRVVATENLRAAAAVAASQIRVETSDGFPDSEPSAQSIDQVTGHVLRRAIRTGSAIPLSVLAEPKDVSAGDPVKVEVHSGAARLEMDARAESGGRNGETVSVLNLKSGKKFPAQVSGKGRVLVSQ